jgi:hypothetical protein
MPVLRKFVLEGQEELANGRCGSGVVPVSAGKQLDDLIGSHDVNKKVHEPPEHSCIKSVEHR